MIAVLHSLVLRTFLEDGTLPAERARGSFVDWAQNLDDWEYTDLLRKANQVFAEHPREKPARIKEEIIREREYFNQRLVAEDLAEFDPQPRPGGALPRPTP